MTIYYTADTHFGHANIIRFCDRPFAGVAEMDAELIARWNEKVGDDDDVYVVGDFAYRNAESAAKYLRALSGRKHLVVGNHDRKWMRDARAVALLESSEGVADIVDGGRRVVMCHYPLMTWPGRESYMVHGHIHDDTRGAYWPLLASYGRALNAGVDVNGFEPCTLDELVENNRKWKAAHGAARMTLSPADFDAFAAALEAPVAPEFLELLEYEPLWAETEEGDRHEA